MKIVLKPYWVAEECFLQEALLWAGFLRVPLSEMTSERVDYRIDSDAQEDLQGLHLMKSAVLDKPITTYPVDGDHEVIKPRYESGKVWINVTQYFANVPDVAWNFHIGGYG